MKRIGLIFCSFLFVLIADCQVTGSFVVAGSTSLYYPVTFNDGAWGSNVATEFTLGRSNVHQDGSWHGTEIARFRFHANEWGNGASFINADIIQGESGGAAVISSFFGGWKDASLGNGTGDIVIWLRGGTTTYYYNSNYAISPVVYDGVAHALPYVTPTDAVSFNSKTTPDAYVNQLGLSLAGTLNSNGSGNNYFAGNVGIGTAAPISKLHLALNNVPGLSITGNTSAYTGSDISISRSSSAGGVGQSPTIQLNDGSNAYGAWIIQGSIANGLQFFASNSTGGWNERMRVTAAGNLLIGKTSQVNTAYLFDVGGPVRVNQLVVNTTGADFVFEPAYKLMPLNKVDEFIKTKHYLPGIASAAQMQKDGLDVGDNQTKLLQKIEELTLYVIQLKEENETTKKLVTDLRQDNEKIKKEISALKNELKK